MGSNRQELVAQLERLLRIVIQACILDGDGSAAGKLLRNGEIATVIGAVGCRANQRNSAENAFAQYQWYNQVGFAYIVVLSLILVGINRKFVQVQVASIANGIRYKPVNNDLHRA